MTAAPPPPSVNAVRAKALEALEQQPFDLLVIGGGIVGCGIARDAALRGWAVALVEKDDFAAGTSSRSTKLVHGGLRYLEQAHFKLVFESVNERALLIKLAPHLVRPLAFLFPTFKDSRRGLFELDVGLWMYDALSKFSSYRLHKAHRARKVRALEPMLRADGLKGGVVYYDCTTDDARLTLENAIDAQALGAVTLNHVRAAELLRDGERVTGAQVVDTETGATRRVRARVVVNATGPWTDQVRALIGEGAVIKPTKGVHVVLDAKRLPLRHAVVMFHPADGRVMFAIPWFERTVLGTTDTYFEGRPDDVVATREDADYLLAAANAYFPEAGLTRTDVVSTWAGLRPLIAPQGEKNASSVSREHLILDRPGMVTIAGGKLTTYRRIAKEAVDRAALQLGREERSDTARRPLPSAVGWTSEAELLAEVAQRWPPEVAAHLVATYGVRAKAIAERAALAGPAERIDSELPFLWSEVDEALAVELARTVEDVLARRVPLLLRAKDRGVSAAPEVARRLAVHLGWSQTEAEAQVAAYRRQAERLVAF